MINFIGKRKNGRFFLGLIITKRNIELLKDEHPIHISKEELGLKQLVIDELLIAYFENEEEALKGLEKFGFIGEKTVVIDESKKKVH